MFIAYLSLGIILLIAVIYFGLELSKNIHHYVLQTFFWVIYLATTLTWINIIATVLFYNVLRNKRGPPGLQGPIGEKGDRGQAGMCDVGCKNKVCHVRITTELNQHYYQELQRLLPNFKEEKGKIKIQNRNFLNVIRQSCHSEAFNEISKIKKPDQIIVYMSSIFREWLTTVLEYDSSSDKKKLRDYLETDGLEEIPLLGQAQIDPIEELKRYDVYHWGKDRIFHPVVIQYCADPSVYKTMPQKSPPRLKAIRTNMYNLIYQHPYATGSTPVSFYRTDPYNFKGIKYYPLGDIVHNGFNIKSANKFVEKYGVPDQEKERNDYQNLSTYGPESPNLLVYGPRKYVQAPLNWELIWRNKKGSAITIWKPKDHYDHEYKKWFRGLGFMIIRNHGPNPRHQYGYSTPDKQPIRMLSEDILEEIGDQGFTKIWDDRNSASPLFASIWLSKNPEFLGNQNTGTVIKSWNKPSDLKVYKLANDTFVPLDPKSIKFENKMTDQDDLGIGYHGTPHRDPKYSIFTWLEMPLEVQVSNLGTGDKIFLTHSGLNQINSYMIRQLKEGQEKLEGAFGTDPQNKYVSDSFKYNPSKEYLRWEIICITPEGETDPSCSGYSYLIKSVARKLYLKVEIDKTGLGEPDFRIAKLPNKDAPYYKELMNEFIWFNPKSATGNRLLMDKVKENETSQKEIQETENKK